MGSGVQRPRMRHQRLIAQASTIAAYVTILPSRPVMTSPAMHASKLAAAAEHPRWIQGTVRNGPRHSHLAAVALIKPSKIAGAAKSQMCQKRSKKFMVQSVHREGPQRFGCFRLGVNCELL